MVDMKPRNIATAQAKWRESNASPTAHYRYEQSGVQYNEPFVTYNYFSNRGQVNNRIVATPTMKGR
jgi:hypothetical protein